MKYFFLGAGIAYFFAAMISGDFTFGQRMAISSLFFVLLANFYPKEP